MVMTPYRSIVSGHQAVLPAWNGVAICDSGCTSCNPSTSLSYPQTFGHDPGSGDIQYYEPEVFSGGRSPKVAGFQTNRGKNPVNSPVVSMTPYYNTSTLINNYLIRVPFYGHGIWRIHQRRRYKLIAPPSTCSSNYCGGSALAEDMASWIEQYDYNAFYAKATTTLVGSLVKEDDVQQAIAETQSEAALASYKTYDALTDILQFKQLAADFSSGASSFRANILKMLSGHSSEDIRRASRIPPKNLLKSSEKALRKIGGAWLAYRYLLMPLIYSYNDIKKTLERWQITRDKATRIIGSRQYSIPSPPQIYILKEEEGSIRVTSTVACKYTNGSLARAAAIGMNPLTTAWELIPYSFVIDWFLNIGDYIGNTFSLDLANSSGACTALKISKLATYTAVWNRGDTVCPTRVNETSLISGCFPSNQAPARTCYTNKDFVGVLRTVRTESYTRTLFRRRGATKLQFNPHVTWKRAVDAGALSLSTIKKLIWDMKIDVSKDWYYNPVHGYRLKSKLPK